MIINCYECYPAHERFVEIANKNKIPEKNIKFDVTPDLRYKCVWIIEFPDSSKRLQLKYKLEWHEDLQKFEYHTVVSAFYIWQNINKQNLNKVVFRMIQ